MINNIETIPMNLEKIPETFKKRCFNASIIKYSGKTLMFYRIMDPLTHISEVYSAQLNQKFQIIPLTNKKIEISPQLSKKGYCFEDPRAFIFKKRLFLCCCAHNPPSALAGIIYLELDKNLKVKSVYIPNYGNNSRNFINPQNSKASRIKFLKNHRFMEKNWQFFENEDKLFFIYSIEPHKVIEINQNKILKEYPSSADFWWKFGIPRGSTPPVKINNEFLSFFHSSVSKGKNKIYSVGAYTFSPNPPFKITKITKSPIISGDKINTSKLAVIFPSGAILENNSWVVSCGYNDESIKIIKFSHDSLLKLLTPIKRTSTKEKINRIALKSLVIIPNKKYNEMYIELNRLIGKVGISLRKNHPKLYKNLKKN